MSCIRLIAALAVAAAVGAPPAAHGATIYQDGRTPHKLLLQAGPGESNLVSVEGSRSVVIRDDGGTPIRVESVPTCMPIDPYAVSCSAVRRLELDLGDAPDFATIATSLPVEIEGGNGPDRYTSVATEAPSRVDFHGGIGFDTASYGYATTGVTVSLDLSAGDGRPGDEDRIGDTVERVVGSRFADVLTGGRYAETLLGLDGDDQISGGAARDILLGGDGNDRIDARDGEADTVDCGGYAFDRAVVDIDAEASITGCEEVAS